MAKKASKNTPQLPTRFLPPRTSANRQGSFPRFLDMPLELRHMIYSNLLLSPTSVDVWSAQAPDDPLTPCSCNRRLEVAILRTNKQIYDETSRYLYSTNTFTFMEPCDYHEYDSNAEPSENPVIAWLHRISPLNTRHIRSLQLRIRTEREFGEYYSSMLRTLASQIPNLTRIAVVAEKHKSCRIIRYEGPGHGPVEYDGEDTDGEENEDDMEHDVVLMWSPNMGMFVDPMPKVFKSYFVTAIPTKTRLALAKELQAFKHLGLILLYGNHDKHSPHLVEFCGDACAKLSQCTVQETHDTKLHRLTLPWGLEVANEYQWRDKGTHKIERSPKKSSRKPADVDDHHSQMDDDDDEHMPSPEIV